MPLESRRLDGDRPPPRDHGPSAGPAQGSGGARQDRGRGAMRQRLPRHEGHGHPARPHRPGPRGRGDSRRGRRGRDPGEARRPLHPLLRLQLRPLPPVQDRQPPALRHQHLDRSPAVRRHRQAPRRRHGHRPDEQARRLRRVPRSPPAGLPPHTRRGAHARRRPDRLLRHHRRRLRHQHARRQGRHDGRRLRMRRRRPPA